MDICRLVAVKPFRKRNPPRLRWVVISGRLRQFELQRLDALAAKQGIARAELIARAVRAALELAA